MNFFNYKRNFVENYYLTYRQKIRQMIIEVFGHEGLYDVSDLAESQHDIESGITIYRIQRIHLSHLAVRKIMNPFKWVEFLLTFTLESIAWGVLKAPHALLEAYPKNKLLRFYKSVTESFLYPAMQFLFQFILGVARRIVAPVKYLVRPMIEFAKRSPKYFIVATLVTIVVASIAAIVFICTPLVGLGLVLAGALGAAAVKALGAIAIAMVGAMSFSANYAVNVANMRKKMLEKKDAAHVFKEKTTAKISATLHHIAPKLAVVKPIKHQGIGYTLSLFTGTESLFFPNPVFKTSLGRSIFDDIKRKPNSLSSLLTKLSELLASIILMHNEKEQEVKASYDPMHLADIELLNLRKNTEASLKEVKINQVNAKVISRVMTEIKNTERPQLELNKLREQYIALSKEETELMAMDLPSLNPSIRKINELIARCSEYKNNYAEIHIKKLNLIREIHEKILQISRPLEAQLPILKSEVPSVVIRCRQ